MKPPYGDIDLDVIREVAKEARTLCYQQDRREAGSDLAKALHNCDRFLGLMAQEIERLRAELEQAKAELTALKEPPKVVVRPAFYVNPDDYPEEDMESP